MKFRFRADAQDVLIFVLFAIFLLYVVSLGVINLSYLAEGESLTLNPFPAFSPEYLTSTIVFYIIALIALLLSVSSYFFDREEGVGFSLGKKDKGYSRWAKDKEMKAVLKEVDPKQPTSEYAGIPLISKNGKLWVDNGEYHTLVIGATGAGKTQSTILPAIQCLAKKGESMILTDPKGELYEGTGELLKSKGYDIIVLNFRSPQKGNAWNPMTLPYRLYTSGNKDKAIELLDDLALNILYEENSGNSDPFWEKTSADYFSGLALGLFEDAPEEKININSISLTTTVGEEKCGGSTYVKEYFNLKDPNSPAYINASGTIMAPNETKGSIISVFKQKVKLFSSRENLSEMLSYSDFDLRTIGERPTAVFIIIQDEKKTYHSLATIFIKQCYETLIDVAQEHGGKLPCRTNFLLDEFANMPPLKDVTTMITAARSRQVRFTMIIQNFAQLTQVYGKENAETIKGNCGNIVYLISTELSALEEISKLCGEVKSKKDDKTASTPLVTVSDLQRMKQFDQIVLRLRMQPFKTSFTPNFKIDWGNQKFPKMGYIEREKRPVQVFDVREFVKEKRQQKIREMMMDNSGSAAPAGVGGGIMSTPAPTPLIPPSQPKDSPVSSASNTGSQSVDIDDLVRKIDAKIAEIEKEEKAKNDAAKKDQEQPKSSGGILSSPSVVENKEVNNKTVIKEDTFISNESIENKVNEMFTNSAFEEKMDRIDEKVEETIIKPGEIIKEESIVEPKPSVTSQTPAKPTISLDDIDENQFFDDFFED
ncbi:MAG: type IV secretory system conjugative DNA transfer family protein [Bacilli bacterium]|nr:type IV secretory system conjugative DNA transfer family protein [Bacilli bacterium]